MKRGTPRHPKVADLMQALEIRSLATAVGYLELLWHFTAEFAPQGDIGRYSDARIEGALGWSGKAGRLIQSLTTSKWVELHNQCRLVVHDWDQHADDSVRKKLARSGLSFVMVAPKVTGQCPPACRTSADNIRLPEPEPQPEPEPHTQPPPIRTMQPLRVCVSDLNGQTSQRFEEWWQRYPRKVGKDATCRSWTSVVSIDIEDRVFACLARYLASGEVARGVVANPANWIDACHRDSWECDWPGPRQETRKLTPREELAAMARARMAHAQEA